MIVFTNYDLFTMMGMGEKPRNMYKRKTRKNSPFGRPPILPPTKMEADCFPVYENTENKPDPP